MLRRLFFVWVLLAAFGPARADTLKLANGDEISGEIVDWALDHVVLKHPQLGTIKLSLEQLELDTGKPPSPGLFGTRFLRGWNRRIDFGFNGKQGNSENTNFVLSSEMTYADAFKRWRTNARWFFNADEDGTSDNNARLDLRRDWLTPESRWFGFVAGRYQFDDFEAWEHRVVLGGGPGYNILKRPKHSLDATSGLFFTREFGDRQQEQGEVLAGLEYVWNPHRRYSVRIENQLFLQAIPDAGEIRNLSIGELRIRIVEEPLDVSFTVGVENEYETDVEEGDELNDIKYFMKVGLGF
ncbi:MAG: DUF481 domain-containing protein [Myxococcota bacterium]|nr:DUF481 domain-containing protein [Myxococcota bacterium]